MTRSFIISLAMVAMSGASGFALSAVHGTGVAYDAPVLQSAPLVMETPVMAKFIIPEFVPVVAQAKPLQAAVVVAPDVPAAVPVEQARVVVPADSAIGLATSLRPKARTPDLVVTQAAAVIRPAPAAKATPRKRIAAVRPALKSTAPRAIVSTRSSSAPMLVSQARNSLNTFSRAQQPEYVVGVYR